MTTQGHGEYLFNLPIRPLCSSKSQARFLFVFRQNSLDYCNAKTTFSKMVEIVRNPEKQMNEMSDHIAGGGCNDFNEYQHCTGIIKGLAVAERELLDLNSRIEDA